MKRSDDNYSALSSLKELRAERERIAWQKQAAMHKVEMSIERLKRIFSFDHLLLIVNEKLEIVRSFAKGAQTVIEYIVSLFRRKNKPAPVPTQAEIKEPEAEAKESEIVQKPKIE